jgi:hypothetical protein
MKRRAIFCQCEALASLRHVCLGCFFLEPENIKNVKSGGHLELWQSDMATVNFNRVPRARSCKRAPIYCGPV